MIQPSRPGGKPRSELVLLTRMPNGKFSQKTLISETGSSWTAVEMTDANRDGIPDLRIFDTGSGAVGITPSHWYQGFAGLKFRKPAGAAAAAFPEPESTNVDVDWDGDLDLWKTSLSGAGIWTENTGASSPGIVHQGPGGRYYPDYSAYLGNVEPIDLDFDGDGHPDYIANGGPALARGHGDQSLAYYPLELNTATASLHLAVQGTGRYDGPATFLDVDGDGDLDYFGPAAYSSGAIEFRFNSGGSGYSSDVLTVGDGFFGQASTCLYADIDGDGIPDVVSMTLNNRLQWFKGGH